MTRTAATHSPSRRPHAVSRPHDRSEAQADRAADVVARGGSVAGWSFGSVPAEAGVHRQEKGAPPKDEDKLKEAAKKVGEGALETKEGKALQEKVKETPLVKGATKFFDTTTGKFVAGGALAAGATALGVAKQPLPAQLPALPLDSVKPGMSAKVTVEGPVNAPTFVGLSLTFKEQGPKGKPGPTEKEKIAADIARLRAQQEMFKPQAQKDQEKADEQATIAALLAAQQKRFGTSTLVPLKPGDKPKTVDVPKQEQPEAEPEKKDDAAVQRAPAGTREAAETGAAIERGAVENAVRGGGRPLDQGTRRSMEARFGVDFGGVRIHDSATASATAGSLSARAFTVGEDVVFASGSYDPRTYRGRHLLAHELAHVVQQRGSRDGAPRRFQRRGFFENVGILLGLSEGTWSDRELRAYLDAITAADRIDGSYDADNKARAIVRRWKAGAPQFDLTARKKRLLIDEMLDGPTTNGDEECILDLLERSTSSELRIIFTGARELFASLDSDLDGTNHHRLLVFVTKRFVGGRSALETGRVIATGLPEGDVQEFHGELGFGALVRSDATVDQVIDTLDRFLPADRERAADQLLHRIWPQLRDERGALRVAAADAVGEEAKVLAEKDRVLSRRIAKAEALIHYLFLDQTTGSAAQLAGTTRPLDPEPAKKLTKTLRPKQYDQPEDSVEEPTFHDPDKYRAEIEGALPDIIDAKYKVNVTDRGTHAEMSEVEAMAPLAKRETDAVFGEFYDRSSHPEMRADRPGEPGNLHSWYQKAGTELDAMTPDQRRKLAQSWLRYYYQSDPTIRKINDKYDAEPDFAPDGTPTNDEAKLLRDIAEEVTADDTVTKKLVETRRGWGGMAQGGNVFVDLYHHDDVDRDRAARWQMFHTLVHEYMHTLAEARYRDYARSLGATTAQYNTLIEGVDCVLSETVWANVRPRAGDQALREPIEGAAHAKLPAIQVPAPNRYPSYEEAVRLVALVGFRNVCAAYFSGLVDRVRAPAGGGAP